MSKNVWECIRVMFGDCYEFASKLMQLESVLQHAIHLSIPPIHTNNVKFKKKWQLVMIFCFICICRTSLFFQIMLNRYLHFMSMMIIKNKGVDKFLHLRWQIRLFVRDDASPWGPYLRRGRARRRPGRS